MKNTCRNNQSNALHDFCHSPHPTQKKSTMSTENSMSEFYGNTRISEPWTHETLGGRFNPFRRHLRYKRSSHTVIHRLMGSK